ncbi:GTP-binding protein [Desulfococcus sp.]|uniref:CobW family GTP-binding protein n=1 Tax=Desulfococcus sp. TaxID=2025834 RepID=UPI003593B5F7
MGAVTDVFLITGFLGSGKTTFLNRLTRAFPPDRKLVILMNEFGDIGVDGLLVEGEDLEVLEISRGSIFCVCVKTDFIRGLAGIAREIRPDVLIIEATGAADPGDMKRDLGLSVFRNRFRFREQICLIDAVNFTAVYDAFASVEKQMAAATCFIINKTDLAGPSEVIRIREIVGRHHPDPVFHETTFGGIPLERFAAAVLSPEAPASPSPAPLPEAEIDQAIEILLRDPLRVMLPPDTLASAVIHVADGTRDDFLGLSDALPAGLLRAKGFVRLDGDVHLFSWVMGKGEVRRVAHRKIPDAILGRLVCIGPPALVKALPDVCGTHAVVLKIS